MKISIGKLVMHCLTACMPLLVPGDGSGGLIGATEPTHQMDAINIVVLSCSD